MRIEVEEKLFEQIFGHTLIKLADKLINTTKKEENQIIVKNFNKNNDKIYKKKEWLGDPTSDRRISLFHAIKLILDFNEEPN